MLLMDEDEQANKEPYSIAILRSFALNLFQIYHNENKGKNCPEVMLIWLKLKELVNMMIILQLIFLSNNYV
jgi:hypothetical protein